MGHVLLAAEGIIASILFVAFLQAWCSRIEGIIWRTAMRLLAILIMLVPWATVVVGGVFVTKYTGSANLLIGSVTAFSAFFIGAGCTLAFGHGFSHAQAPRRRAREWRLRPLLTWWLATTSLAATTFMILDLNVKNQMTRLQAKARTIAIAATPPRISPTENAAIAYQQVWAEFDKEDKAWDAVSEWLSPTNGVFDPQNPEMLAFLKSHEHLLEHMRQANKLPGFDLGVDYNPPSMSILLPDINNLRRSGRLFCLSAKVNAFHGRHEEAIRDLNACFALAEKSSVEPTIIGVLVGSAIENLAKETLNYLIVDCETPTERLAEIKVSDLVAFDKAYADAIQLECAAQMWHFSTLDTESEFWDLMNNSTPLDGLIKPLLPVYRVFAWEADWTTYEEDMQAYGYAVNVPYYEQPPTPSYPRMKPGIVKKIFFPSLGRANLACSEAESTKRMLVLATKMWQHKRDHGDYPESFDALVPDYLLTVPIDPLTGQSFHTLKNDDGSFAIYSVGNDLMDDGGTPQLKSMGKGDNVLWLEK